LVGLSTIEIAFKQILATPITGVARGNVGLIVFDDTEPTFVFAEYNSITKIDVDKFTDENVNYIKDVMASSVSKVIVTKVAVEDPIAAALALYEGKQLDWICIADGDTTDQSDLASWVKSYNLQNKKTVSAIVCNQAGDDQQITNFVNEEGTKIGETTPTLMSKLLPRFTGLYAALPMDISAVGVPISWLKSVKEVVDKATAVGAGGLVLTNDDGVVCIERSINSLQTLGGGQTDDFKFITIIETLNKIQNDVASTIKSSYKGLYKNTADNQALLIGAINGYLEGLEKLGLLDPSYDNHAEINVASQRAALISVGKPALNWDNAKVIKNTVGDQVFPLLDIKVPNAMESFKTDVNMA